MSIAAVKALARRHVRMWKRPMTVPEGWRIVDFSGPGRQGRSLPALGTRSMELLRLVLDSCGIPYMITGHGTQARAFVPAMFEKVARAELAAVAAEKKPVPMRVPLRRNAHWAMLALMLLIVLHGVRMGWWLSFLDLPSSAQWLECGRLDVALVRAGEWWRAGTALTLHVDGLHLFSNVAFTAPFFMILAQRIGLGTALFSVVLSGACGNFMDVAYRDPGYASIGASTAMFGVVGLLCADIVVRSSERGLRRIAVPVAAGMAFLAMLGAEGQNIDYAAHIFGLAAGFALGIPVSLAEKFRLLRGRTAEWLLGAAALVLLAFCWMLAFRRI